jgi:DNA-binding transcriptional ArsR family regulator
MGINQVEAELWDDSRTFLHPVRRRILELLAEKLMNINAISIALSMERRLVAHHLFTLEDWGYVKSRYAILQSDKSKGKALRVYTVTDKVVEVKAELKKTL